MNFTRETHERQHGVWEQHPATMWRQKGRRVLRRAPVQS